MTLEDGTGSQKVPMRDRIRSETRRILAGVTGWLRADTQRQQVVTAREGITTAVQGGIAVGIGAWITYRIAIAELSSAQMTTSNLLFPGVKEWIADDIGILIGPLMSRSICTTTEFSLATSMRLVRPSRTPTRL